jgi:hypothetical protein
MKIISPENLTYGFDEALEFVLNTGASCVDNLESARGGEHFMGIRRSVHPGWPGWFILDRERESGRNPFTEPASGCRRILRGLVRTFYRENFWQGVYADTMPFPLSLVLFDSAVVHGRNRALRFLQEALNTILGVPWLDVDGIFRSDSRRALDAVIVRRDPWYLALLVSELLSFRQAHCDGIGCGDMDVRAMCAARVHALSRISDVAFGDSAGPCVPSHAPEAHFPRLRGTTC